jgi:hypothetical protein
LFEWIITCRRAHLTESGAPVSDCDYNTKPA